MFSIGCVIVTYNRLEKLKTALKRFEEQEYLPQYVIVVDNASDDGTAEYLDEWKKQYTQFERIVINCDTNSGGAGGFHKGIREAINKNADWIWVSDDDAYLKKDALKQTKLFLDNHTDKISEISAICGTVLVDGEIDIYHRRSMKPKGLRIIDQYFNEDEYKKEKFELNCFSYVGTVLNKKKLEEVGPTNKDYFIWFDDTEHSLRLSKVGKIYCVPSIKVEHDLTNKTVKEFGWKSYYAFRNLGDIHKKYFEKKYYRYYIVRSIAQSYYYSVLERSMKIGKMIRCAIKDCRNNKLGMHEIYKPGWKVKK